MERRLNPRKNARMGIMLEIPSSGKPVAANLLDISLSGAFIEIQAVLSTSSPLIMTFKLPGNGDHSSFRLYARVIRRSQTGVGVAFLPMPSDMLNNLRDALSRFEPKPGTWGDPPG